MEHHKLVPVICTQCGASMDVSPDQEVVVCEYCGTTFPMPKKDRAEDARSKVEEARLKLEQQRLEHQMRTEQAQQKLFEADLNKEVKKRSKGKTVLWVLGWLFIFPVPLTILMLRNQTLDKKIRYGIIAAGWIVYLLIGLFPRSDRSSSTSVSSSAVSSSQSSVVSSSPVSAPAAETVPKPEPEPEPEHEPEPEPLPEKNGFDSETNSQVEFAGLLLSTPEYFERNESSQTDENITFSIKGESSNVVLNYKQESFSGDSEYFSKSRESIIAQYLKAIGQNGKYTFIAKDTEDISFAGLSAIELHTSVDSPETNESATGITVIAHDPEAAALTYLQFLQTNAASFDYTSDIEKIILTAEQAPASPKPESNGVTPEVKEFYDSYEAVMDEYVDFMKDYDANDLTQAMKLLSLTAKISEFEEKSAAYEESGELSDADSAYASEVLLRVSAKMAAVSYTS